MSQEGKSMITQVGTCTYVEEERRVAQYTQQDYWFISFMVNTDNIASSSNWYIYTESQASYDSMFYIIILLYSAIFVIIDT